MESTLSLPHASGVARHRVATRNPLTRFAAAFNAVTRKSNVRIVYRDRWPHAHCAYFGDHHIQHGDLQSGKEKHPKAIFGLDHAIIGIKHGKPGDSTVRFQLECSVDPETLRRLCKVATEHHVTLCIFKAGRWLKPYLKSDKPVKFSEIRGRLEAVLGQGQRVRVVSKREHKAVVRMVGCDHISIKVCSSTGCSLTVVPSTWHMFDQGLF